MKGKYHIEVSNRKLLYQLDIERKVTVIKGKSGTGKTTLIRMLQGYLEQGNKSGIKVINESNVQITVFTPTTNWERDLQELKNHIIFMDEAVDYLYTKGFQTEFAKTDNYLVVISRSGKFAHLPYAVNSIYELRTEKNQGTHLTKMYRLYNEKRMMLEADNVITEDANAGREMMECIFPCKVVAAAGNGKVAAEIQKVIKTPGNLCIIVDGAAFGGFISRVMALVKIRGNACVFAPESFEYLILSTDNYSRFLKDELKQTWNYCDSSEFLTWERYFTVLLDTICFENFGFHYSKSKLNDSFKNENIFQQIKELLQETAVQDN